MDISIKALTPNLLKDYLYFFDNMIFTENPEWSSCYCFSYHFTGTKEQWNREENRAAIIKMVNESKMTGYLAFYKSKPIGWCNVNDRSNYQHLLKYFDFIDNPKDKVCSIVCFLIQPDFRRQGIAQKFLRRIYDDYSQKDYDYIEAYPRKGELSCERHYKGPFKLYEKFDFKIKKTYDEYFVVRKKLR